MCRSEQDTGLQTEEPILFKERKITCQVQKVMRMLKQAVTLKQKSRTTFMARKKKESGVQYLLKRLPSICIFLLVFMRD